MHVVAIYSVKASNGNCPALPSRPYPFLMHSDQTKENRVNRIKSC